MNDIRLNKEQEKDIVMAKFKVPALHIGFFVYCIINAVISLIAGIISIVFNFNTTTIFVIALTIFIFLISIFLLSIIGIKKSSCVITNKRIYGVTSIFIIRKKFSYRLDEIDNIETISIFGIHGLALNFSQGHGPKGVTIYKRGIATVSGAGIFRITNIANVDEVYDKLSNLLTSIKNDKDLMVDIEMSKIDAENRKAAAFENMANNFGTNPATKVQSNNPTYIEELKGLKQLLDSGVISEEEFNEKKKNLLK